MFFPPYLANSLVGVGGRRGIIVTYNSAVQLSKTREFSREINITIHAWLSGALST
jgi:hypothetical protein